MPNAELDFLSAVELAAMIRTRKVSPVEVIKAVLARIEQHNPALNAFVTMHTEEALCAATRAEDPLMRGQPVGQLHGVPLHVKDNLYVAGSRTTFGSKLDQIRPADRSADHRRPPRRPARAPGRPSLGAGPAVE